MGSQKTITIKTPTNASGELTHQIRNFGEDLWREVEQKDLGDVGGLETVCRLCPHSCRLTLTGIAPNNHVFDRATAEQPYRLYGNMGPLLSDQ